MSIDSFRDAYLSACAVSGSQPSAMILQQCEPGAATGTLICNRSARGVDNRRLSDADGASLAAALGQGHPFSVVDCGGNSLGRETAALLVVYLAQDSVVVW